MKIIKLGTWLLCGCCGQDFKTWQGYKDQDQDTGYGICKSCQGEIEADNKVEQDKLIATMRSGLNPDNQAKYDAMDRDLQFAIAMQALDEGQIVYKVTRAG